MATYSLGLTGAPADNPAQPLALTVDDAVGRAGAMASAMQNRTPFLAKGVDGVTRLYTYDAERSIPGVTRVLRRFS